jgi:hypothetical protein
LYEETKAFFAEKDKIDNARNGSFGQEVNYVNDKKKKKGPVIKVIKDPNDDSYEYKAHMGQVE